MQTRYLYILRLLLTISDLMLINICFFVSFYLCNKYGNPIPEHIYKNNVLICNLIWLLSTGIARLYAEDTIDKLESIYRATWRSIVFHIFIFLVYLVFANLDEFPRTFIASFYV